MTKECFVLAGFCEDSGKVNNAVRTGGSAAPHPVGTHVTYICNTGFPAVTTIICQANREWTPLPICNGMN